MADIINLDDHRGPWTVSAVTCSACGHSWHAVCPAGTDLTRLECSACGSMSGVTNDPPKMDAAQYWEAQASMWHENYKEAIRHEDEARRYKDALLRIKGGGYGTKERVRQIIMRALGEEK